MSNKIFDKIKKYFYERRALNLISENKPEASLIWLKKLELMNQNDAGTLHNLSIVLITLKNYEEARSYIKKEIKLYGDSYLRYRVLGDMYYQWNKRKEALESYKKSIRLYKKEKSDESEIFYLENRINICSIPENFSKAINSIKYFEEANELYEKKEYEKALFNYEKTVLNDYTNFLAHNAIGAILLNNYNDFENAEKAFLTAKKFSTLPIIDKNLSMLEIRKKYEKK